MHASGLGQLLVQEGENFDIALITGSEVCGVSNGAGGIGKAVAWTGADDGCCSCSALAMES
jgi:hypothetical protein